MKFRQVRYYPQIKKNSQETKQAGAELGQAQFKLDLVEFTIRY